MLKLKDNNKLNEIVKKYNMEYEGDSDWEFGWSFSIFTKDGIVLDVSKLDYFDYYDFENVKQDYKGDIEIYGIDNSKLDILYDLIKLDLVEKINEQTDYKSNS